MADATTDPSVIEELLRQRGLLATGGNIRMMPFSDGATGNGSPTPPSGSATTAALQGAPDPNAVPFGVADPNNLTPADVSKLENASDDELRLNWPLIAAGAAGSALALYLKSLIGKRGIVVPGADNLPAVAGDPLSPIPTVEGTLEDTPRITGGDIQEGQFTDATPRLPGQRALPAPNGAAIGDGRADIVSALSGRQNAVEQGATPPKYLTARTLAERKVANQNNVSPTGNRPVAQADEFTDVAPDEMKKARAIARELIAQRQAGIKSKGKLGPSLLDPETALHDVVRVLRETKALRALQGRH